MLTTVPSISTHGTTRTPILKAWQKVFPTVIKPYSEMSGGDLMSHVRYPEDLFKVQRELLGRYHVTDPDSFYQNNDAWSVPNDPTVSEAVKQPPFYMSLQMPDQEKPAFQLTSSFIPQTVNGSARNILYGFLAADSDAGTSRASRGGELRKAAALGAPPPIPRSLVPDRRKTSSTLTPLCLRH